MKKVLFGVSIFFVCLFLGSTISYADSLPVLINSNEEWITNNDEDGWEEITPLSEVSEEVIEDDGHEELIQGPMARSATGYTYKNHTTMSTKTYTNKLLKTLKTSSVWSTASNSVRPTISLTVSQTNSISISLSNGTNNFNISQSVSLSTSESYTAKPKARGYRVSIGLYAKKVVAKRVRISAYSNGSGKFSHYIYANPTTISGVYVGEAHKKG